MTRAVALALVAVLAIPGSAHAVSPRLPGYDADGAVLTVSGLSSGGYMAVQFHVAHSARVKGVGVFAGGPYYCAQGSVWAAYFNCMTPGAFTPLPPTSALAAATEALARAGRIDAVGHLSDARVWLFSGSRDETTSPEVVGALAAYYRRYVPAPNVKVVTQFPAGHALVSADADVSHTCGVTRPPFINRCIDAGTNRPFDAAGVMLAHLLGAAPPAPAVETGEIIEFDQREFADGRPYSISLSDDGYAYIPAACRAQRCRVHVAFHGCRQNMDMAGRAFVRDAGYNRWADAHRLIVLYPQTIARNGWGRDGTMVLNVRACWDWWGYTGPEYPTRDAPQIRAVKAMVDRLASPR